MLAGRLNDPPLGSGVSHQLVALNATLVQDVPPEQASGSCLAGSTNRNLQQVLLV